MSEKELEEKVIRAYEKGIPICSMHNFGICDPEKASAILHKFNKIHKRTEYRPFLSRFKRPT